jgi:ribosome-associated protein
MADDLRVDDGLVIPRGELTARATRAGGPGGQHVNTSSTRIELVWNVHESRALTDEQRERLLARLGARLDADGALRVVASASRSQLQNRRAAEERLAELVRRALVRRRKRIATRPSRAAVERRLEAKKKRSHKKRNRRSDGLE